MKKSIYLYIFLAAFLIAQLALSKRILIFPDLVLIIVVFAGVFLDRSEALAFSLSAGFLRGCFSPETLPVDILLFPAVALLSSVLTKMFYRQNPAAQVFLTMTAALIVVSAHTLFLNMITGNSIGISSALLSSWKSLLVTILASPFIFAFLKGLLKLEE